MNKALITQSRTKLEEAGFKLTPARRAVIEALARECAHLTAPQVVQAVGQRAPGVGRASVYRTLELLARLGLVQVSSLGRAASTYVLCDEHHHHVICRRCHQTVEFEDCNLDELGKALSKRLGYHIEGHLVEFYGCCPDCHRAQALA